MMKQSWQEQQAEFEAAITERQRAGDRPGEAELRGRLAYAYSRRQEWEQAAAEFARARELAELDGETAVAARYHYAEAMSLQMVPQRRAEAQALLAVAARQFAAGGDAAGVARTHQRQAMLHAQQGENEAALAAIDEALHTAPPKPAQRAELHLTRAMLRWLQDDESGAETDLDEARHLAADNNNELLQARIDGVAQLLFPDQDDATPLASLGFDVESSADPIETLLQQSLSAQPVGPLQEALAAWEREDYTAVLTHAESARETTLQRTDPARYVSYLSACLLIALAREQQEDFAGVIAILLTAKATLERQLGRTVGRQMNQLLDSLYDRWGETRFQEALRTYREAVNGKR